MGLLPRVPRSFFPLEFTRWLMPITGLTAAASLRAGRALAGANPCPSSLPGASATSSRVPVVEAGRAWDEVSGQAVGNSWPQRPEGYGTDSPPKSPSGGQVELTR